MGKNASDRPVVGVDLGGTKVLAGVVAPNGEILGIAKRPTKPQGGVKAVVERIVRTVRDAAKDAGVPLADIAAVCSGAPGVLNPEEGVVRYAPNMAGWEDVPFARLLSDHLDGLPVYIENDGNLGLLGEYVLGAGVGYHDLVGIAVGTGIGGGLILDGKLWQGSHKTAAEIGHTILMVEGPVCGCGSRGCVEALASRTAIERDIMAGIKAGRVSLVPELIKKSGRERLTSGVLAEAYRRDDLLVREVMGRAQFYIGLLITSVINFIDPQIVILGGGVIEAMGDSYLDPVRRVAYQYPMNKRDARTVPIVAAKLGDHSALLGAAVNARQRLAEG